jgi:hypothetical protein
VGRIRSLKPEFNSNEGLSALSCQAHLLAAALLCYSDDEGFFNANPALVRAGTLPLRRDFRKIEKYLNELEKNGYIRFFDCKGKRYGQIVHFNIHQKISHPAKSSISILLKNNRLISESSGVSPESLGNAPTTAGDAPEVFRESPEILRPEQGTGNREQGTGNREEKREFSKSENSSDSEPESENLFGETIPHRDLDSALREVFAYYLETMHRNPNIYSFSPLRRKKGLERLQEAKKMAHGKIGDAADLMRAAIDAVAQSDFHMGRDAKTGGKSYCNWEDHIFRTREQFESWINRAQEVERREQTIALSG